jgi:hypothetical protein
VLLFPFHGTKKAAAKRATTYRSTEATGIQSYVSRKTSKRITANPNSNFYPELSPDYELIKFGRRSKN